MFNDGTSNSTQRKIAFLAHNRISVDSLSGSVFSKLSLFSTNGNTSPKALAISPEFYYLNNSQTLYLAPDTPIQIMVREEITVSI